MDTGRLIDDVLRERTWLSRDNSNTQVSPSLVDYVVFSKALEEYVLKRLYSPAVVRAHNEGSIYIHTLHSALRPYCNGVDPRIFLLDGLRFPHCRSRPARHFSSAVYQSMAYMFYSQLFFAGAQAMDYYNWFLAPYAHHDRLGYAEIKQAVQGLVYQLNQSNRTGAQSAFTNIGLRVNCPSYLKEQDGQAVPVIYRGEKLATASYADYEHEARLIYKAFMEVMREGDGNGLPFTFPIITTAITRDLDWNDELWLETMRTAAEKGTPYFFNLAADYLDEKYVHAMCCRLFVKHCLPFEESVIIRKGNEISIESIGEVVEKWESMKHKSIETLSFDTKLGKIEWKPIINATRHINLSGHILCIKTKDGKEINVSENHPCLVLSEEGFVYKKAEEIRNGDYLLTPKQIPMSNSTDDIRATDFIIEESDFAVAGKGLDSLLRNIENHSEASRSLGLHRTFVYDRKRDGNMRLDMYKKLGGKLSDITLMPRGVGKLINIDMMTTSSLANIIGFFLSEGNIFKGGVTFTFNENEKDIACGLSKQIMNTFGLDSKILNVEKKNAIRLQVNAKVLADIFRGMFGINRKSKGKVTKRLPKFVFSAPEAFRWAVIDSFFTGDGTVKCKRGQIDQVIFSIRDKEMVNDISLLLYSLGIAFSITHDSRVFSINVQKGKNLEKFMKNAPSKFIFKNRLNLPGERTHPPICELFPDFLIDKERIKDISSQYLRHKIRESLKHFRKISAKRLEQTKNIIGTKLLDLIIQSDVHPVEVTCLTKKKYSGFLYDIEVAENNNFVHGYGLITHNSGGIWQAGGMGSGSNKVVTLNLPRIALLAKKDEGRFFEILDSKLEAARRALRESNEIVRKSLYQWKLLPLLAMKTADGAPYYNFRERKLTIGMIGMNECLLNLTGVGLASGEGLRLGKRITMHMAGRAAQFSRQDGATYTLEQTPAEAASHKLATADIRIFRKRAHVQGKQGSFYYTNSTHVPYSEGADL
ncbi:MAG: hypothetical protein FJY76_00410, partial [Candidatus Aenigmarchaeota archaeon]|nr:hypothetical protein [Candidatus Aenigmarchaeota archaeon]